MQSSTVFYNTVRSLFKSRVYPNYAPEDTPKPFLVYTEPTSTKENSIDGGFSGDSKIKFDAYLFADDYDEVKSLKDAVIAAMEAQTVLPSCSVLSDAYSYNETVASHVIMISFVIWEQTT